MDKLEELKGKWASKKEKVAPYDASSMSGLIRQRTQKHLRAPMKFFWASFTLQLIVYGLYAHVIVRFYDDPRLAGPGLLGILLFLPFTYTLMRKFKQLAVKQPSGNGNASLRDYITEQKEILQDFFKFKLRYEWMLIPLSSIIGTWLVFSLYVPDGPTGSPNGVLITSAATLLSCFVAIRNENKKGFREPISELDNLLKEFEDEG